MASAIPSRASGAPRIRTTALAARFRWGALAGVVRVLLLAAAMIGVFIAVELLARRR